MVTLDGIYNTPECLRLSSSFRGDTCTYDETSNERVFRCEKMDNFCTNSHLRGDSRASVFAAPVYAEELRTFASDAQHKGFVSNIHAVILVGDATNQRRYQGVSSAPTRYLCQNVLDSLIYRSPPLLAAGSLLH